MLTLVDLRGYDGDPLVKLGRARVDREAARTDVRARVAAVRERGDVAIREDLERFGTSPGPLRVPSEEVERARATCDPRLLDAIGLAAERIRAYHERQAAEERAPFWRAGEGGAIVGEETRAVDRAGCLVPGGVAPLASTALMTVIPARVAGVRSIAVCATPARDGRVHPSTLAAIAVAGGDEVFAVGGPAAVAALAYGTESIARADVIVGPGSFWTTLAKHEVAMDVGIDSFAGPTEVLIVADDAASPRFVAADLIAQAEHDPLATALLVTPSRALADAVLAAVDDEVARADRRADIEKSLRDFGRIVLVDDLDHAMRVADAFAPEHLEIVTEDAEERALHVRNAGAVFVGPFSPVALGDYVAGTNHVLPTAGSARFASPLRASTFIRSTAVISFTRAALEGVGPALAALADAEGLTAHRRALDVRLEEP